MFRLLALRSDSAPPFKGSTLAVSLLGVFSLAIWAGIDWLRNAPDPQFYPYEGASLAWVILTILLLGIVMAKRSVPAIAVSRVCAVLAIVLPVLLAANFAIEQLLAGRWMSWAGFALFLYSLVYCSQALKALTGRRQWLAVAAGLAVAFVSVQLAAVLYVDPTLWAARSDVNDNTLVDDETQDTGEEILFEQPARIDASVANVAPAVGEVPVGFFVGFAGYGEQKVFAEEIKFAADVVGRRFDTSARTVLLLNDQRSLDAQPLASIAGLRYALKAVASKMRLDQDVLFLVLSSHGSEDPLLSVSNGSLPLRDLSGDGLADALRESRIKWRVIVISACHAGAFIEPLRDPQTIVITAAAPDRSSFGCADERDLTYFGEAFFRDALPNAASLREAFETTKTLIAERELQAQVEPSRPQAFFGELLEPRLRSVLNRSKNIGRNPAIHESFAPSR